jgi:hypothetical protein
VFDQYMNLTALLADSRPVRQAAAAATRARAGLGNYITPCGHKPTKQTKKPFFDSYYAESTSMHNKLHRPVDESFGSKGQQVKVCWQRLRRLAY